MSIIKPWISGPLYPKPKLILTELQGLTLSTPSLVYIYFFDWLILSNLFVLYKVISLWKHWEKRRYQDIKPLPGGVFYFYHWLVFIRKCQTTFEGQNISFFNIYNLNSSNFQQLLFKCNPAKTDKKFFPFFLSTKNSATFCLDMDFYWPCSCHCCFSLPFRSLKNF